MLRLNRPLRIALILVAVAGGSAQAHPPRLAGPPLALYMADGPAAALRLLYGDGILGADPVRPIVVGEHGEVYALGPKGHAVAIACTQQCRVFIFLADETLPRVLVPDKTNFLMRAPIHRVDDDGVAATEQAAATYGFLALPLGPVLLAQGAWAFVAESPLLAALLAAIALGAWPTCRLALAARRAPTRSRRTGLGLAAAACAVATLAVWVLVWGAASFVIGFPAPVAMLITGGTAVVVLASIALAWLWRRRLAAA
jgi:hypothetical protein